MKHHCGRFRNAPVTRRGDVEYLRMGFGAVALQGLLQDKAYGGVDASGKDRTFSLDPLKPRKSHHEAKAKSVIFLYMDGGVSHVDSFDPKVKLKQFNGEDPTST